METLFAMCRLIKTILQQVSYGYMNRDEQLLAIRPSIETEYIPDTTSSEYFQNEVLRPILKFQNDLFLWMIKQTVQFQKSNFAAKIPFDQQKVIAQILDSDRKFKASIVDSCIALMTTQELSLFQSRTAEYRKRIISMVSERLIDQLVSD